MICDIWKSIQA